MAPAAISVQNGATNGATNGSKHSTSSKEQKQLQDALRIIEEKVPEMKPLNAVLKIDIGLPDGALLIDLRDKPCKIIQQFDGEPDCSVKVKPLYIKRFYEGAMDPRYGLFKDGIHYVV